MPEQGIEKAVRDNAGGISQAVDDSANLTNNPRKKKWAGGRIFSTLLFAEWRYLPCVTNQ